MQLSNVSFRYPRRDHSVLREVSAVLAAGDVVELAGPNGVGKSTLLRLLAGLTRPTGGTIAGRPAVVGLAPDRFPVEQPFTVSAYLDHMSRVRGGARWEPWAERLDMIHLLGVRLSELSKGSAHKVGLAQALMADPGLLLLDEPFAGLDADTRRALAPIVAEVSARGAIVVVSDHQGGLRDVPAVRHWALVGGILKEDTATGPAGGPPTADAPAPATATATATATAAATGGCTAAADLTRDAVGDVTVTATATGDATVAVTLPAGEVPAFLGRMRAEGYAARPVTAKEAR